MSHDVFQDAPDAEKDEEDGNDSDKDLGQKVVNNSKDILKSMHHVFVKEVVREPRMHF